MQIKIHLKSFFKSNTLLYSIWFMLNKHRLFELVRLPRRSDEYYFDGYPRSGNTFVNNFIKHLVPGIQGASHLHCIAGLKMAFRYRIPAIILIRHPFDAISSNAFLIKEEASQVNQALLDHIIKEYVEFYGFVAQHQHQLYIISFRDFFEDRYSTMHHLLTYIGKKSYEEEEMRMEYQAHLQIMKQKEKQKSDRYSSLPNEKRKEFKKAIKHKLKSNQNYTDAVQLYERIVEEKRYNNCYGLMDKDKSKTSYRKRA